MAHLSPITRGFLIVIIILSVFYLIKRKESNGVLVSFGILGTFVGICIALRSFDSLDIASGIPNLIGGLKTSFVTSIAGILGSIITKICSKQELRNDEYQKLIYDELQKLNSHIGGEGDSSLSTQIAKLRNTTIDKFDGLNKSFDEFAEKVADNNSKSLITALEEVMKDFNSKINEQFGDNFKQLNEAVGGILQWQEKYKEQVDNHIKILENNTLLFKNLESQINDIVTNSKSFEKVSQNLSQTLNSIDGNLNIIKGGMSEFSSISDSFEKSLEIMTDSIEGLQKGFISQSKDILDEGSKNIEIVKGYLESLGSDLKGQHSKLIGQLETTNRQTLEKISNQIIDFDKQLGDELNKALQSLGSQLTSLSRSFVEDYSNLADQLQRIVNKGS